MNGSEIALSGFLSGFATAYFSLQAYQLFRRKDNSRLQIVVAVIFVQWALFNLKDFFFTINDYSNHTVQDILTLIDGLSLIGYTSLLYELIEPRWATWSKAGIMLLPYIPFFLAYMTWPSNMVIYTYLSILVLSAIVIFLFWAHKAINYKKYIHENYSNIDEIDISWLRIVAWFFIACQLIWLVITIVRHPITDCLYYTLSIILWQITFEHILHQKPVVMYSLPTATNNTEARKYAFADKLDQMLKEEQPYLNPTLSLKDMASHLGTNRTYLSDYITHVLGTNFYDYINSLRIERQSLKLMREHPDYTLERIAIESGFQSLSTFRRAFQKQKGMTPSEYRKSLQD